MFCRSPLPIILLNAWFASPPGIASGQNHHHTQGEGGMALAYTDHTTRRGVFFGSDCTTLVAAETHAPCGTTLHGDRQNTNSEGNADTSCSKMYAGGKKVQGLECAFRQSKADMVPLGAIHVTTN